ncbi:MAG: cation diffusion facilitator family transporter [Bryobacteraceae bacterium]|nr:cation diffusion facilitator family transporter [Bryobacteraceae bacterium]
MSPETNAMAEARFAMRLSLATGLLMLAGKVGAYWLTGSAAILSDAAESIIHMIAVAFATFSLWLSTRPADRSFLYGYERITFFSAGFEGAMIILAAGTIVAAVVQKWRSGLQLERLNEGALLVLGAAVMNLALGLYLLRTGKRARSLILEANGKHVLTDSWTSFGVIGGLVLVMLTGWTVLDPLVAIGVALNILWSGGALLWRSARGLMDYAEPSVGHELRQKLDALCGELGVQYHGVRYRNTGQRLLIEVHLLFPATASVGDAHRAATEIEERLSRQLTAPAEVVTHLEALEDHADIHREAHYTGKPAG